MPAADAGQPQREQQEEQEEQQAAAAPPPAAAAAADGPSGGGDAQQPQQPAAAAPGTQLSDSQLLRAHANRNAALAKQVWGSTSMLPALCLRVRAGRGVPPAGPDEQATRLLHAAPTRCLPHCAFSWSHCLPARRPPIPSLVKSKQVVRRAEAVGGLPQLGELLVEESWRELLGAELDKPYFAGAPRRSQSINQSVNQSAISQSTAGFVWFAASWGLPPEPEHEGQYRCITHRVLLPSTCAELEAFVRSEWGGSQMVFPPKDAVFRCASPNGGWVDGADKSGL